MQFFFAPTHICLVKARTHKPVPRTEMLTLLRDTKRVPLGAEEFGNFLKNPNQIPITWKKDAERENIRFIFAGTKKGWWVTKGDYPCFYWDVHGQLLQGVIRETDTFNQLDHFVVAG